MLSVNDVTAQSCGALDPFFFLRGHFETNPNPNRQEFLSENTMTSVARFLHRGKPEIWVKPHPKLSNKVVPTDSICLAPHSPFSRVTFILTQCQLF